MMRILQRKVFMVGAVVTVLLLQSALVSGDLFTPEEIDYWLLGFAKQFVYDDDFFAEWLGYSYPPTNRGFAFCDVEWKKAVGNGGEVKPSLIACDLGIIYFGKEHTVPFQRNLEAEGWSSDCPAHRANILTDAPVYCKRDEDYVIAFTSSDKHSTAYFSWDPELWFNKELWSLPVLGVPEGVQVYMGGFVARNQDGINMYAQLTTTTPYDTMPNYFEEILAKNGWVRLEQRIDTGEDWGTYGDWWYLSKWQVTAGGANWTGWLKFEPWPALTTSGYGYVLELQLIPEVQ